MKTAFKIFLKVILLIVLLAACAYIIVRVTNREVKKENDTKQRFAIDKEEVEKRCKEFGTTIEFFPGDYNKTKVIKNLTTYKGVDYSRVYNSQYYYTYYGPAKDACGKDEEKLIKHFVTEGMELGVRACEDFDVTSYYNANKDLRLEYGPDFTQYYEHYIREGYKEDRKAVGVTEITNPITEYNDFDYAKAYDLKYFLENNEDVVKNFRIPGPGRCIDDKKAIEYFIESGLGEFRQASKNFDIVSYFLLNEDLRELYRTDLLAYVVHYVNNSPNDKREALGKHDIEEFEKALFNLKPTIEKEAINMLNDVGHDLYSAYAWCASIPYVNLPLNWSAEGYALYAYGNWCGNCFAKACALYYMAKQLGYDAHVVRGFVRSALGKDIGPHGWVEIGGLIYDPDYETEIGLSGFGLYYGQRGTWQYSDYWYMT